MYLVFKGGAEIVKLSIDRKTKTAFLASRKTMYQEQPIEWRMLFDKGKEKEQERLTDGLNDDDFKKAIILSMAQNGYQLIQDG